MTTANPDDKVEATHHNMVTLRCHNAACWHNGVERQVGLIHLEQGIYVSALALVCECGKPVEVMEKE